jgi:ubiquinone biosynthesis monooxygenase Coq7
MKDSWVVAFDKALRTVFGPAYSSRPVPGEGLPEADLSPEERRHAAALMRVNHSGEVCAQALYQGQALTSSSPETRNALASAAWEETEHLNWTATRIAELGGRKSLLNPLWYLGSLALGVAAGKAGDRWNLGFLAETERQVTAHLADHLGRLPGADGRSRAVVAQMKDDESRHAETAVRLGASDLSTPVRLGMRFASRVMTRTAYWL